MFHEKITWWCHFRKAFNLDKLYKHYIWCIFIEFHDFHWFPSMSQIPIGFDHLITTQSSRNTPGTPHLSFADFRWNSLTLHTLSPHRSPGIAPSDAGAKPRGYCACFLHVVSWTAFPTQSPWQQTKHFVGSLPSSADHFSDSSHGLRVRSDQAKCTEVVKDILCCNGFSANARFGERNIFGNLRVQMMTDHQHIQVLVDGINGEGACGVSRRR